MVGFGLLILVRDWSRDGERTLMVALSMSAPDDAWPRELAHSAEPAAQLPASGLS